MADDWQPIETAPKDGRTIIITGKNFNREGTGRWLVLGHWREQRQRFMDRPAEDPNRDLGDGLHAPTHWMAVPEFPDANVPLKEAGD